MRPSCSHKLLPLGCLQILLLLLVPAAAQQAFLGPAGNTCPAGSTKLTSIATCIAGMHAAGVDADSYNDDENDADWPSGCYLCSSVPGCTNGVWFNAHPTGRANGGASPVCASAAYMPPRAGGVLFVGDSDIDYWPRPPPFAESYNVGVGGATCADTSSSLASQLAVFSPATLLVVCGENDLAYGRSVNRAFRDFKAVVSLAQGAGVRVLTIGTKPEPSTSNLHDEYRQYDSLVQQHASSLASTGSGDPAPLVVIDSYASFQDMGNPRSLYASDRLHLSASGYGNWSTWAQQALSGDASTACEVWRSGSCVQGVSQHSHNPHAHVPHDHNPHNHNPHNHNPHSHDLHCPTAPATCTISVEQQAHQRCVCRLEWTAGCNHPTRTVLSC
mmetsp:Transcript_54867/g.145446  ORF Transcript_54867/g.145446 Transcript_54867/m.145446 type:complete len:387 (+) Transcript_54867:169-1329(+)